MFLFNTTQHDANVDVVVDRDWVKADDVIEFDR